MKRYRIPQVKIRMVKEGPSLLSDDPVSDPQRAVELLQDFMGKLDREEMVAVMLNSKLQPISFNIIAVGSIDSCHVPIYNIFKPAILANATSILIAHNHPSGDTTPSREDKELTRHAIEAGNILNIPVLDHIIFGSETGHHSMKANGELPA